MVCGYLRYVLQLFKIFCVVQKCYMEFIRESSLYTFSIKLMFIVGNIYLVGECLEDYSPLYFRAVNKLFEAIQKPI